MARSAIAARGIEGLVGAVLGGGAGAAGAALFHEPKKPRTWSDEQGRVHDRPLTSDERKVRNQLVARVALMGALGGAGASLGTSAFLGKRLATVERQAAQQIADDFLTPMRHLIDDYKGSYNAVAGSPGGVGEKSQIAKDLQERVRTAQTVLQDQETAVHALLGEAKQRRSQVAYRGAIRPRQSAKYDHSQLSHPGMVQRHFEDFAKAQGHQGMRLDVDGNLSPNAPFQIFEEAVRKAMTKTSQAAFAHELYKIAAQSARQTG